MPGPDPGPLKGHECPRKIAHYMISLVYPRRTMIHDLNNQTTKQCTKTESAHLDNYLLDKNNVFCCDFARMANNFTHSVISERSKN